MRLRTVCLSVVSSVLFAAGCGSESQPQEGLGTTESELRVTDADIEAILNRLSLDEKAGQMIQAELYNLLEVGFEAVQALNLGSVLNGGDSLIQDNSPQGWQAVHDKLQAQALMSSSGIPILYGIDAVHGHNGVHGATLFPHNIGLGATRDPALIEEIGAITAKEVVATGIGWTFAPCLAVARDERWGRTYESWGEDPALQNLLAGPYVRGLQGASMTGNRVVATAKHFLGDGGTTWGTGMPKAGAPGAPLQIDRGDTVLDLAKLKQIHGQGYVEATKVGVGSVMVSFSKVNGLNMSGNKELVTGYLKGPRTAGGLGFEGFVITDWNSINDLPVSAQLSPVEQYKEQVIASINAGVDMLMVEGKIDDRYRFELAHDMIQHAVLSGRIPVSRVNDAVTRILRIKLNARLFNKFETNGTPKPGARWVRDRMLDEFGSDDHRAVARTAVRKSVVLLKNSDQTLPIRKGKYETVFVAGKNADDFGGQNGGWTYGWQGSQGNTLKSNKDHTILEGIRLLANDANTQVEYAKDGKFAVPAPKASLAVVVIGEKPYAEFFGDSNDLSLDQEDQTTLANVYALQIPVAVVLVSGRPMIVTAELPKWQSFVAAWLPGSQGEGVADVLFGQYVPTGKLPATWPKNMAQLPINTGDGKVGLFPYGFGLTYSSAN